LRWLSGSPGPSPPHRAALKTGPDVGNHYTFSRDRHVEVDGEFADAVLGRFAKDHAQFIAVLEGKSTRDPLDRPFAGRRMSAVDQAYRYTTNLPCDWIMVTSMRETRLYYKGAHQQAYERFETIRLAADVWEPYLPAMYCESIRFWPCLTNQLDCKGSIGCNCCRCNRNKSVYLSFCLVLNEVAGEIISGLPLRLNCERCWDFLSQAR